MISFKHHLSLILPLVAFLISFQLLFGVDRVTNEYEKDINSGYSIIIASIETPSPKDLGAQSTLLKEIEEIDADIFLSRIKENFSAANIALLKVFLPKFYRLKLHKFPSEGELKSIKKSLLSNEKIKRVETYEQTHKEVYSLLSALKRTTEIFTVIITLISTLLVVKQIEVWRFEHSQRMEIMALFGAPYWMRSATLFKLAVIDSLISIICVAGLFFYIQNSGELAEIISFLNAKSFLFDLGEDVPKLFALAFGVSLGSVFFVIFRQKEV